MSDFVKAGEGMGELKDMLKNFEETFKNAPKYVECPKCHNTMHPDVVKTCSFCAMAERNKIHAKELEEKKLDKLKKDLLGLEQLGILNDERLNTYVKMITRLFGEKINIHDEIMKMELWFFGKEEPINTAGYTFVSNWLSRAVENKNKKWERK